MEIAFHLGAHQTDEDRLIRCLMRNRAELAAQGIAVPGPGQYRQQLRKIAHEMSSTPTTAATQEALLDGILDEDAVRRVVFSWDGFLAQPAWALSQGRLYPAMAERASLLARLFPAAEVSFYMALRNPATLLPALARVDTTGAVELEAQAAAQPGAFRWSVAISRLVQAVPQARITLWCDEDTPLLWAEALRAVSGHPPGMFLHGWLAWYWDLVTPKGHDAMRRWFEANPPEDDLHRRKMLGALLTRFARPEANEAETLLPGWTEEILDTLSEGYEHDLDLIAAMPGVTLLEP